MQWFRSVHGAPTHKKWLTIARKSGQPVPVVVSVVWALMDHASRQEDRGSVKGFDAEDAASYLGIDDESVLAVLATLADRGWITDDRIGSWDEHQVKRERDDKNAAERAKSWREARKTKPNATERQPNADKHPDTDTDTDTDKKDIEGRAKALSPSKAKKRKTSIPENWEPDGRFVSYAQDKHGWDPPRIQQEAIKFKNHWRSKGETRADWLATWRNWVIRSDEYSSQNQRTTGDRPTRGQTECAEDIKSMLRIVEGDSNRDDGRPGTDHPSKSRMRTIS